MSVNDWLNLCMKIVITAIAIFGTFILCLGLLISLIVILTKFVDWVNDV